MREDAVPPHHRAATGAAPTSRELQSCFSYRHKAVNQNPTIGVPPLCYAHMSRRGPSWRRRKIWSCLCFDPALAVPCRVSPESGPGSFLNLRTVRPVRARSSGVSSWAIGYDSFVACRRFVAVCPCMSLSMSRNSCPQLPAANMT